MIFDRLFGRKPTPPPPPPPAGIPRLPGDLWLDRPDATTQIDARLRRGEITTAQAETLQQWVEKGYITISIDLPATVIAELLSDVERFWKEKPDDVLYAYDSFLRRFVHSDESRERRSPYRIMEIHSVSRAAFSLYLNRQIFDWVELIFGETPVATQSIFFEFGSQQGLHRDPVYVQMKPASHLVACWIALEDIRPGSGELMYVPGSHRFPYYELAPGRWVFDFFADGPEKAAAMQAFDQQMMTDRGLKPETFLPRKGQVLLWHGSLMHGGSPVTDPSLTRKSFVVHYTSLANHHEHAQLVEERVLDESGATVTNNKVYTTSRVITHEGCHGFASPIDTSRS